MKKITLIIILTLSLTSFYGQNRRYNEYSGWLRNNGYTIKEDKYVEVSEGNSGYIYRTFYTNTTYKILAFADDDDVTDVDLYLFENGEEYDKDIKASSIAQLDFSPTYEREMKVRFKNTKAKYPSYTYKIRMLIGFK